MSNGDNLNILTLPTELLYHFVFEVCPRHSEVAICFKKIAKGFT